MRQQDDRVLPIPPFALAIALIACGITLALGVDPAIPIVILFLWLGTLWLTASRPPEVQVVEATESFPRERMRDLIENAATPMLLLERDRVVTANLAARRALGGHVVGQDVRVAFRNPEAISFLTERKNGSISVKGLARRRDIWDIGRQSLDDNFAVIELINRTAEADISRAHSDFVANASHELRTPLASIIGYVETLRDPDTKENRKTRERFLDTIEREARRLHHLVQDLMSLSRIEAEKHDRPTGLVDLHTLVGRAARDASGEARMERLEFGEMQAFEIAGDEQQLEQLVRNLVDNALKYGRDGEPVTVALANHRTGDAVLTVADRGDGIAPEHIPYLTRRFYRTDPGRSRASGGTGLGLAIVKHIVERHRGRLDIDSKAGEGTTVSVRLPVETKPS